MTHAPSPIFLHEQAKDAVRWVAGLCLAVLVPGAALAQQTDAPAIQFEPLGTYSRGEVKLVGGKKVDPQNWRTMLVAKVGQAIDSDGKVVDATCSAILVGEGVALTAAHCLDVQEANATKRDRIAALKLNNSQTIILTCLLPKKYAEAGWAGVRTPRHSDDWALCRFDVPTPTPAELKGFRFEVLDPVRALRKLAPVLMSGFGCKELRFSADGRPEGAVSDGIFTIGDSQVTASRDETEGYVEIQVPWGGQPALCPGDSGGPLLTFASVADQAGARRIAGVNSSVAFRLNLGSSYDVVSFISPVSATSFHDYVAEWESLNSDRPICGRRGAPGNHPCRN